MLYEVITTSVTDLYLAGIPAGFIIGLLLISYTYFTSRKREYRGAAVKADRKEKLSALKDSLWALGVITSYSIHYTKLYDFL